MATQPLTLPEPFLPRLAKIRPAIVPVGGVRRWRRPFGLLMAGALVSSLVSAAPMTRLAAPGIESVLDDSLTVARIAPPPAAQYPYKGLIAEMAAKYDLSPELVAGVVYIESNFDKNAVSHAGAIGLMQLMPATAAPLARRLRMGPPDLTDPRVNLELGCYFLRILLDKYDGHLPTALSFYNGGHWGIVSRGQYRNRRYIRKVMDSYWRYAQPVSNGKGTAWREPS